MIWQLKRSIIFDFHCPDLIIENICPKFVNIIQFIYRYHFQRFVFYLKLSFLSTYYNQYFFNNWDIVQYVLLLNFILAVGN